MSAVAVSIDSRDCKTPGCARRDPHAAARGFADWLDRRGLEHDDPAVDDGASLGALWQLWLAEHACGVSDLDYAEAA